MANKTPPDTIWHTLTADAVLHSLKTNASTGLGAQEAAHRLRRHGPNAIQEQAGRGLWATLIAQFANFMTLVLIAAAIIAGIIGDATDSIAIVAIVLLNVLIGFVQEYRAERTLAALRRLASPTATVMLDGFQQLIPAEQLVPGDVVLLEAGGTVPADLRLIEAHALRLGEAALTGESQPVDKITDALPDPGLPLGDRRNMVFKATSVLFGRARGVVVATGMQSELGRIADLLRGAPITETPLQHRLTVLGRQLALAAIAICLVIFVMGLLRGEPLFLMLLTALSLAVAAIPEALPAVVTILLALGARKMARERALIRRLPAVETLGSVTFICSDKTGTLTENRMRAIGLWLPTGPAPPDHLGNPIGSRLATAMALCNDVVTGADGTHMGDPTEIALWEVAVAAGYDKLTLASTAPRIDEIPFSSERKRMTTLHPEEGGFISYTKGAPEAVLACCRWIATADGTAELDADKLLDISTRMASEGQRVLAFAYQTWPEQPRAREGEVERDLILLGLVGLIDPPRPEAAAAVATCKAAGMTPVMVTGDHPATARAIAQSIGIAAPHDALITGRELAALSDDALADRVLQTRVYARVDPAQKIRIVRALQAHGELVAMTGDGVNDAPALAHADIGVAMGQTGTDVARDAASLVLLDDNFASIVVAVREGRRIYDNIRKFVRYVLTCNTAEIWVIFLAPFLGLPVPLLPIHILWINVVTDGLPGLALAFEPEESTVMRRPPRPPRESIVARGLLSHVIWVGLLMAGVTLLTQGIAINQSAAHWQTLVFTVLTFAQMGQLLAIRSEHDSLFQQGLLSNRPMMAAILLTVMLQLLVIYVPVLNDVFHTAPLTMRELLACILISSIVFVAVEIEKWLRRRG